MAEPLGQYEFVDLRDDRDDELLHAFYTELYLPAFPIICEQEDPGVWAPRLWGADSRLELHILLAGTHLGDPKNRILAGGAAFELYRESRCGLLTYLVVAPSARRSGLSRSLVTRALQLLSTRAAETVGPLRAVFAETNDPSRVAADRDSMDPRTRLEALGRLGARIISMPYVQPELVQGQGRGREMLLVVFHSAESHSDGINRDCVIAFLEDFYRSNGISDPSLDREFQEMVASLAKTVIPLIGYGEGR